MPIYEYQCKACCHCFEQLVLSATVYCWNLQRSLFFAKKLKESYSPRIIFGGPEITADNSLLGADHAGCLCEAGTQLDSRLNRSVFKTSDRVREQGAGR